MSLQTPARVRRLQRARYVKAKQEPAYRFYLLYDKVYRDDVLHHAYRVSRAAIARTPGVDGVTFADIEAAGQGEWLAGLKETLRTKTYRPAPVRRVLIPRPGGGHRPLGIPTIRDRVVQTAAKLVLEPIFEADFRQCVWLSTGAECDGGGSSSPRRAVRRLHGRGRRGPVGISDSSTRSCCRVWPAAWWTGICCTCSRCGTRRSRSEWDAQGKRHMSGGKRSTRGTPQGGVISPTARQHLHAPVSPGLA